MTKKWKLLVLIVVMIVVVLVALIYLQLSIKKSQYTGEKMAAPTAQEQEEAPLVIVPATGNVDDTVGAFLQEINQDQSALSSVEGDETFLEADSQEVGDLGQIYNENEF
jgi:flagellar basal body-associated protein FliL